MNIAEKLTAIAENEEKVYAAGKIEGETEGYATGFDDGKKAEYDAFWDLYQQNGKRTNYDYAFGGDGWNDETFKPKYDIKPYWNVVNMFYQSEITDLESLLNECGVVLQFKNNANYGQSFAYGKFTILPEITFGKSATNIYETFSHCEALHTIRKLTFEPGFSPASTSAFNVCTALANVVFGGELSSDINMKDCPLTRESIESLFSILSDSASGKTATLKKTAKEAAFTDDEWSELCATKPNWNFELV